jgi:hypothetical protein
MDPETLAAIITAMHRKFDLRPAGVVAADALHRHREERRAKLLRSFVTEEPAATVPDPWIEFERGLAPVLRSILQLLAERQATTPDHAIQRSEIGDALGMGEVAVKNALTRLRKYGAKIGRTLIESSAGQYGGTYLTADGASLASRIRIPPSCESDTSRIRIAT